MVRSTFATFTGCGTINVMVDFEQLDSVMDKVGEMPVAYGLRFRKEKPHTTLHFERGDGQSVHLYVTVNKDYLPVSMVLVHPPTPCVGYRSVPAGSEECKRLVADLYGFLCQLAAWTKSFRKPNEQRDTEETLVKATDSARLLEQAELRKAA